MQPDPSRIAGYVQRRLHQLGLDEVSAVEAASWLNKAGLLKDSAARPGLPLRDLLRRGQIPQGEQRPPSPHGRWFIVREILGTTNQIVGPSVAVDEDSRTRLDSPRDGESRPVPPVPPAGKHRDAVTAPGQSDRAHTFTRAGLTEKGFEGFNLFKGISLDDVPPQSGVYVVLREKESRPVFLIDSPAGWFKGQNPTVPVAELERDWPDSAQCVYIGKAGSGVAGGRGLRDRIKEFRHYGDGRPVGHQGGRRVWQLADADHYVLAWLKTPGRDPAIVEGELITAFIAEYGKRPIGNRTSGRSRGI